eukprot:5695523-Amphidinium_carterae.3
MPFYFIWLLIRNFLDAGWVAFLVVCCCIVHGVGSSIMKRKLVGGLPASSALRGHSAAVSSDTVARQDGGD